MLKGEKFFGSVTVGERGQIVIPAAAREALNIKAGDKLLVFRAHSKALMVINSNDLAEYVSKAFERLSEFEKVVNELPEDKERVKEV
ncbi:MAG: AbrB/MazE/SpoVT family DNA-binding domain-containing protein [Actinobacteria bacterium]|nr:AbrB/MazE/SpoVT family DNA-binding domain-containing protein [Actinomycetota bacterium]